MSGIGHIKANKYFRAVERIGYVVPRLSQSDVWEGSVIDRGDSMQIITTDYQLNETVSRGIFLKPL